MEEQWFNYYYNDYEISIYFEIVNRINEIQTFKQKDIYDYSGCFIRLFKYCTLSK